MFNIKSLLPKSIQRAGITRQVATVQIIKTFTELADQILPATVVRRIKAVDVKDRMIIVASLSPSAIKELQSREEEIIERINKKFGFEVLKKIKYLI